MNSLGDTPRNHPVPLQLAARIYIVWIRRGLGVAGAHIDLGCPTSLEIVEGDWFLGSLYATTLGPARRRWFSRCAPLRSPGRGYRLLGRTYRFWSERRVVPRDTPVNPP